VDIVLVCPIVEDVVPPVVPEYVEPVVPVVPVVPVLPLGGFEYVEPEPLVEDPDGGTGVVCAPMVLPDVVSVLPLVGVVCVLGEEEELGSKPVPLDGSVRADGWALDIFLKPNRPRVGRARPIGDRGVLSAEYRGAPLQAAGRQSSQG
jgi:hypothetical protein